MKFSGFKIHYWPGLLLGVYICTVILTYSVAVLNGHVNSLFPYVSDTGAIPPESCIFGELFNLMAVIMGITFYIRYRQVDFDMNCGNVDLPKRWNKISLYLSIFMSLGTTVVANFQETAILVVHMLGATTVFTSGLLYFLMQTRISFATRRKPNPYYGLTKSILYVRMSLSISLLCLFFVVGICGAVALSKFKGETMIWWTEKEGAYPTRLASTFTEWIYITFMFVYIFTFTNEFRSVKFEEIRFMHKDCNLQNTQQDPV